MVIAGGGRPLHLCASAHELAAKAAVDWVGVLDGEPIGHAAPDDFERRVCVDRGRATTKQGIDDVAIVKDRNVRRLKYRVAAAEADVNASAGNGQGPEEAGGREFGGVQVVDLRARTGLIDVNSDKTKGPPVHIPVLPTKDTLHEPHVILDVGECEDFAGCGVCAGHQSADERDADEAIEVGDAGWLRIIWIDDTGPEHMKGATQYRCATRNRNRIVRAVCRD